MKSEINRSEVPIAPRKPFKKNQLVKFTKGSSEAVVMLLEDEYVGNGSAKVICLYSYRDDRHSGWWEIGEINNAAVENWELFTNSLTLSN